MEDKSLQSNNKQNQGQFDTRILVPVADSPTMRETVHHAVKQVIERTNTDNMGLLYFVAVEPMISHGSTDPEKENMLDRAEIWAEEELGTHRNRVAIKTEVIGRDTYVFSPADVANVLYAAAASHSITDIILDPEYDAGIDIPLLRPLNDELNRFSDLRCEEAPATRRIQRSPFPETLNVRAFLATFGISAVFYLVLAGDLTGFNLVTGGLTGLVAASLFSRLLFPAAPTMQTPARFLRFLKYIPFLIKEVIEANIHIAALILHPRMPIEPQMVRIRPRIDGSLPLTLLANSITLTPGTLTARMDGRDMLIHALDPESREGLEDGGLEDWACYIFPEAEQATATGQDTETVTAVTTADDAGGDSQ